MKIKSILFINEMVDAIDDCRKTQTRRLIKTSDIVEYPDWFKYIGCTKNNPDIPHPAEKAKSRIWYEWELKNSNTVSWIDTCPYEPGDVLCVKQNFWAFGEWKLNGITKTGKQKWKFVRHLHTDILFEEPDTVMPNSYRKPAWYKRSSLFLEYKHASRFIRVKSVRPERLQDISEKDAKSEGVLEYEDGTFKNYFKTKGLRAVDGVECLLAKGSFQSLWSSINGLDSWNINPWVWVIEFERIEKPKNFC